MDNCLVEVYEILILRQHDCLQKFQTIFLQQEQYAPVPKSTQKSAQKVDMWDEQRDF